jgi:hypothetical protein
MVARARALEALAAVWERANPRPGPVPLFLAGSTPPRADRFQQRSRYVLVPVLPPPPQHYEEEVPLQVQQGLILLPPLDEDFRDLLDSVALGEFGGDDVRYFASNGLLLELAAE